MHLIHQDFTLPQRRSAMPEGKPFPLNTWYAAAWGHEVKHELAARTIFGGESWRVRGVLRWHGAMFGSGSSAVDADRLRSLIREEASQANAFPNVQL
jgi:hypothetical protein